MQSKLPPISNETFDGDKQTVELKSNKCTHKRANLISPEELRCPCGAGWQGSQVSRLYFAFQTSR